MARRITRSSKVIATEGLLYEWEHDGEIYNRNDPIQIDDEEGKFLFQYASESDNDNGIVVTTWWKHKGEAFYRSFYAHRVLSPHTVIVKKVHCTEHPNYGAIRRPRTGCPRCLIAYEEKHKEK